MCVFKEFFGFRKFVRNMREQFPKRNIRIQDEPDAVFIAFDNNRLRHMIPPVF